MKKTLRTLLLLACIPALGACESSTLIIDEEEMSIDSVKARRSSGESRELIIWAQNRGLFFLPGADTGTSFSIGVALDSIETLAEDGPLTAEFGVNIEVSSVSFGGPTDSSEMISGIAIGVLSIDDVGAEKWEGDISIKIDDAVFEGGGRSFQNADFESFFFEP